MKESKSEKTVKYILIVLTVAAMAYMLSVCYKSLERHRYIQKSAGWYYVSGPEKVYVNLPATVKTDGSDALILYNDDPGEGVQAITTMAAAYLIKVYVGDELIYAYDDNGFERSTQMRGRIDCVADIPEDLGGRVISVRYENIANGNYLIPAIYSGNLNAILRYLLSKSLFIISICGLMLMLSAACFFIYVYMKRRKIDERRILDCALFLLLAFMWCMCASSIGMLFFNRSPLLCYFSYYSFMLVIVPMVYFVLNTGEMAKYASLRAVPCMFYANAAAQAVLDTLKISTLTRMNTATHVIYFLGFAIVVRCFVLEYREKTSPDLAFIFPAFVAVAGTGITGIALYWILGLTSYLELFALSVIVFVAVLLRHIITSSLEGYRHIEDALTYHRLSREDSLTGLKNRRSLEEDLALLENDKARKAGNAAFILMDVNGLKYINDTYGHKAGDELIIGAAACIYKVFADIGNCYRIGGDEFAVLSYKAEEAEKRIGKVFEDEINEFNGMHKYRLSIAAGMSFLLDENKNEKRFSDWKKEADDNMYAQKLLMHQKDPLYCRAKAVTDSVEDAIGAEGI